MTALALPPPRNDAELAISVPSVPTEAGAQAKRSEELLKGIIYPSREIRGRSTEFRIRLYTMLRDLFSQESSTRQQCISQNPRRLSF